MIKQKGVFIYLSYINTITIDDFLRNKCVHIFTKMSLLLQGSQTYNSCTIYHIIEVNPMRDILPFIFLVISILAFFLNLLALMKLIPLFITLPLLFLSIYLTIFSFTHKRVYRGMR
ncbi:hypothetical protein J2Z81_002236 [Virgibacillus campisalis]|uniref:Uncharacterized protein n=1 Tax=Virgibacillus alimentarius TaxID=698769 RepID=A0ABS4S9S2_9BACI|nr:hypothetical protein [Virgibacillus alimentarius]